MEKKDAGLLAQPFARDAYLLGPVALRPVSPLWPSHAPSATAEMFRAEKSEIAEPIMTTPMVATPTTASPSSNTTVIAANIPSTSRATTMPTGPSLAIRTKVTWPAELDTLLRGVGGQSAPGGMISGSPRGGYTPRLDC